jgi:multidrug efflux system membrane fusion protein
MNEAASPCENEDSARTSVRRAGAAGRVLDRVKHSPVGFGLGALLVAILVYGAFLAARPKEGTDRRFGRSGAGVAQSVGVASASRGDVDVVFRGLLGTVTPIANVVVKTQLSGYLTEVAFKEGQLVNKGDFLAQIDPRPYEAQKAQYEGQLMRDQSLLNQARDDLRRYQELQKLDSISRRQAENQAWVVRQYEGAVKADQALVDNQKLNLTYAHIVSPISGRVGLRQVDAGSFVTTGDPNGIALVTQLEPISVIFSLPEDYAPEVAEALKAKGALDVLAFDRANAKQIAAGKLLTLDNTIDVTTGMIKARAQFENAGGKLFPNQFVNVRLLVDTHRNVLTVPKGAIRKGASGFFVFVVGNDQRVTMRGVAPAGGDNFDAASENGVVEVLQGLEEGDRVVVDGADRLRDGAEIRVSDPNAAPGAAGAVKAMSGERPRGETPGDSATRRERRRRPPEQ